MKRFFSKHNKNGLFDECMSSFFRNVDSRYSDPVEIPVGDGSQRIKTLKARSVVVDMEEGVINQVQDIHTCYKLFDLFVNVSY